MEGGSVSGRSLVTRLARTQQSLGARVAHGGARPPGFELAMARKNVRLMIEAAGGLDRLGVLHIVTTAMHAALARGDAETDYTVFAWPR